MLKAAMIHRRRLASLLLAGGFLQLLRLVMRTSREVAEHRRIAGQFCSEWTTIAAPGSGRPLRVHALAAGEPASHVPVAVLVHGFGIGASYLVPLAVCVSERTRVLIPELPGHGLSDHDRRPLTVVELAAALASWIDARGLRGVLLVGHSLGCQVVAEVAARRPELTARIVLIGPTSDARARSVFRQGVRGIVSSLFDRKSYVVLGLLDYRHAGVRVLAHEAREMIRHHLEQVLPRVSAPACVIRGGRDYLVPQRWADRVARLLRAPAAVSLAGWGHAVQFDDPPGVAARALAQWLQPPAGTIGELSDPRPRTV